MIEVTRTGDGNPLEFDVRVHDGAGDSRHRVTLGRDVAQRLGAGEHTPETCVEAAFRFLLDREPKASILARFDLTDISRYFPEFEDTLPDYLGRV